MARAKATSDAKTKLLDASLQIIRRKGYAATSVDDLCRAAGITKGAFFHHFKSKEEMAVASAAHFGAMAEGLFSHAGYRELADPLDRLLGYVEFRKEILRGEVSHFTCLLGTLVQEAYQTNPAIRAACDQYISAHAATVEADIAEVMRVRGMVPGWTASSLAFYIQSVLQGAFILAKAKHGPAVAADCIDHLRRYLELLFVQTKH